MRERDVGPRPAVIDGRGPVHKGTCFEIERDWAAPWDTIDAAPHLGVKRMKSSQMGQNLMCITHWKVK